jgi:hypothetical protein
VVEIVDVVAAEAALVGDDPAELERHLGHEAERAAARGLGKPKIVALELGERVGGESFRAELSLDRVDEVVAERTKIRDMNACPENREQGAGVGEQEGLCRSIRTRFRYQSSSVGGSSLRVMLRPASRSSIFLVHRTTTRRT